MINILGINISSKNRKEILGLVQEFLNSNKAHFITTPNPEIILKALKDEKFFSILNKADIPLPDGIGLKFATWLLGKNIERYTGVALVQDILRLKTNPKVRIAIINRKDGLSNKSNIEKTLDKFNINNYLVIDKDLNIKKTPKEVIDFKPDILFCTFGAPSQEKFIYYNYKKIPNLKLAVGVGGAFDYLSGNTKRAPRLMRLIGLEWLYRLLFHKGKDKGDRIRRFKKIYNAVIVFPKKILKWRFIRPFQYRSNVSCLLYKKENNKTYIFLLERIEEKNHWQMPQGGTDGEDLKSAGLRELREELGTNKFKFINSFPNLYKYKFPSNNTHRGSVYSKGVGYKGQKQGLVIVEYLGEDSDVAISDFEHNDWKWVEMDKLLDTIHPVRRDAVRIFLEKFNKTIS